MGNHIHRHPPENTTPDPALPSPATQHASAKKSSVISYLRLKTTTILKHPSPSLQSIGSPDIPRQSEDSKDVYRFSKTQWPSMSFREVPFLPEFQLQIDMFKNFEVISVISFGAYGKVYEVSHKESGSIYAMKSISKSKILSEGAVRQIKDEVRFHQMCGHHPFLITTFFHWQNKKNLFIVTEFVDGGDLHKIWQQTGCFEEELIKIYVGELAIALDFLHNAGIIHRDLKLENVLIDNKGHIKLIDFGLSKWLTIGNKTRTVCGTPIYMAPEILCQDSYNHAVDWWALGILLYALLQGKFPFDDVPQEGSDELIEFAYPIPTDAAQRITRNLLERDPRKRLRSLRTMQNLGFYHHFDFDGLASKKTDPLPLLLRQRSKTRPVFHEEDAFKNF